MKGTLHVEQAATGYSGLRNSFSKALIVLMCMVGLVLLIACANVANLLIARAFARQKEIAVRLSMGASRGQLVRQLLVESLVLSCAGGVTGTALAVAMTRGLLALVPSEGNPLLIRPEPDLRILLFTLVLTFLTGLIFGLIPALRASRPDLWTTLKDTIGSIAGAGGSLFLRPARGAVLPGDPGSHPRHTGREVSRPGLRAASARLGMGQHHVGGGSSGQGWRKHAGVHELAFARLLRHDGRPDSGGP
jgi:hypothetical protein